MGSFELLNINVEFVPIGEFSGSTLMEFSGTFFLVKFSRTFWIFCGIFLYNLVEFNGTFFGEFNFSGLSVSVEFSVTFFRI